MNSKYLHVAVMARWCSNRIAFNPSAINSFARPIARLGKKGMHLDQGLLP